MHMALIIMSPPSGDIFALSMRVTLNGCYLLFTFILIILIKIGELLINGGREKDIEKRGKR